MTLEEFNLIISTSRGNEENACSEAWFLLGELGDRESIVERTEISGLIVARTRIDPFEAVNGLRRMLRERPGEFRYILKVIPVEDVVRTDPEEIGRAVSRLAYKIGEDETFRVTVEKRHSSLPTGRIIEAAAKVIDRKVNLERPDRIVLIEVLGGLTGISIIRPDDILSVVKERGG